MIGRIVGLLALVGLMTGCSSNVTGQFEVAVKNQTPKDLSVGIVKMHGVVNPGYASPAHFMEAPELAGRAWGSLVKPGEIVTLGAEISFEPGSYPTLRAYEGNKTIGELVAVGTLDPDTCSVLIPAGKSGFVFTIRNGKLTAMEGIEP